MTTYSRVTNNAGYEYKDEIINNDKRIKEELLLNLSHRFKAVDAINVTCSAISTDENYYVLGSDNSFVLYDLHGKTELGSGPAKDLSAVAISHDSKYIAGGSIKGELSIWNLQSLERIKHVPDFNQELITSLYFTNDNSQLISISLDGEVTIYNINNGRADRFKSSTRELKCLALSQDNSTFVIGGLQNIEYWSLAERKCVHIIKNAHRGLVWAVRFSNDEKYLISCAEEIKVWDFQQKERIETIEGSKSGTFVSVTLAANNTLLAAGTNSGKIVFFNLKTKKIVYSMERSHQEAVFSVNLIDSDRIMVSASKDSYVKIWKIDQDLVHFHGSAKHSQRITASAISPDGSLIATGSADCNIEVYGMERKNHITTLKGHTGLILQLFFTHERQLISFAHDNTILFWKLEKAEPVFSLQTDASCITLSHDGKSLYTASTMIQVFDVDFNKEALDDTPVKKAMTNADITHFVDVCVSEDQAYAVAINNRNVFVFDMIKCQEETYFSRAHDEDLRKVAITSDSRYVITAGHMIRVWSLEKKELISSLESTHSNEITGIAITGKNKFVIAGKVDHSIEVWDWRVERLVYIYRNTYSPTNISMSLSLDHKYILTAGDNSRKDFVIFKNLFDSDSPFATIGPNIDMKSRLGLFVLDGLLDLRGKNQRADLIHNYPQLHVYPYDWNLLHLTSIYFPDPQSIRHCVESRIPMTLDSRGLSPIHHLFKKDRIDFDTINYLLSNFSKLAPLENEFKMNQLMSSFSDIFIKILRINDPGYSKFLSYFLGPPMTVHGLEIPRFGKIQGGAKQCWTVIESPYFDAETRDSLISYSSNPLTIRMLRLKMDYDPSGDTMLKLAYALEKVNHEEIFRVPSVSLLVNYLWDNSVMTYYGLLVVYSVYMILFSIWAGDATPQNDALSVIAFLFGIFFLIYEFVQFVVLGIIEYCLDLWNIFDILRNILSIVTFAFIWNNHGEFETNADKELARKWLVSLTLLFGYLKWVKLFVIAKQTRLINRLITQILKDVLGWAVTVIWTIFCFALIYRQFLDNATADWNDLMLNIYYYAYDGFDSTGMSGSQKAFFVVFTIFLILVLMNILVALIIDSLDKVRYRGLVSDSKEKLRLTVQATIFRQFAHSCFRRKSQFPEQGGYLLYVGGPTSEVQGYEEWEGASRTIKNYMNTRDTTTGFQTSAKYDIHELVEDELSMQREYFRKQFRVVSEQTKELKDDMKKIMEKLGIPITPRVDFLPNNYESTIKSPEKNSQGKKFEKAPEPIEKDIVPRNLNKEPSREVREVKEEKVVKLQPVSKQGSKGYNIEKEREQMREVAEKQKEITKEPVYSKKGSQRAEISEHTEEDVRVQKMHIKPKEEDQTDDPFNKFDNEDVEFQ